MPAQADAPPAPPLIRTKLTPPVQRPLVSRTALVDRIRPAPERKLSLVRAPAGWGKSTLLADWYARTRSQRPIAWFAVDTGDNNPIRFWTYLIEALRGLDPDIGTTCLPVLYAPGVSVLHDVVPLLVNEMTGLPDHAVVVIDDYHLIEAGEIHEGLAFVLDHAPPNVEFVLSARSQPPLPLARLRARGELLEIGVDELRFSRDDALELLNDLQGLVLSEEDVARLCDRTEGWAAGLYLAALSLRGRDDAPDFVAAFTGDDRHVVDYLSSEVLAGLTDRVRRFLLRTSVLERLCAPLCDELVEGASAADLLEEIERSNFFLIPLDTKRQWYRYHHLFAQLLRHQLTLAEPEIVPDLHRRAAAWLLDAGFTADAIAHTVAAGDHTGAAEVIAGSWMLELLGAGGDNAVDGWFNAVPDEVLAADVRLCVARVYVSLSLGRLDDAARWLEAADGAAESKPFRDGFPSAEAARACARAAYLYFAADLEAAVAEATRAEPLVAGSPLEGMGVGARGFALLWQGDSDEGERALRRYSALGAATGDRIGHVHGLGGAALMRARTGDYTAAEELARESLRLIERFGTGEHWSTAAAQLALARVLIHRGEVAAGEGLVARAVELSRRGAGRAALAFALMELAELRHRTGDATGARALAREAREVVELCPDPGPLLPERLERVDRLLRLGSRRHVVSAIVEELTDRELSVLRLLRTELSQREIAAALGVSLNTVKSHSKSIFRKLAVSTRAEALSRARELDLF